MIITMIKKTKIILTTVALTTFIFSCSSDTKAVESPPRVNCGKIVRLWSQNQSFQEGNPCGDNADYSRRFAFVVKNDITGNERTFCVNISEYVSYKLGSVYCDKQSSDGW